MGKRPRECEGPRGKSEKEREREGEKMREKRGLSARSSEGAPRYRDKVLMK